MDKRRLSVSDDTDAPRKRANMDSETEDFDILGQELKALKLNREPCAEVSPKSKSISGKRKVDPDKHLELDKGESQRKRALKVTSKVSDGYGIGIAQQDTSKSDYSSGKKANSIKKRVETYFKKSITNSTGTMKNIKGKILNVFKPSSTLILAKEKDITEIDKCKEKPEESITVTKLESLGNWKSRVSNVGKTNRKGNIFSKLEASDTSTRSKDATSPLRSTLPSFGPITQYGTISPTQTSQVRSEKDVWEHFKWSMQSHEESSDMISIDDIDKENMKRSPESEIRSLVDSTKASKSLDRNLEDATKTEFALQISEKPTKTESESASNYLKDITTPVMESNMARNSRKEINDASLTRADNCTNVIKYNRKYPRERIESPVLRIRTLQDPTIAEAESINRDSEVFSKPTEPVYRNLTDITTDVTEYSLVKNAGKMVNKVSVYQVDNPATMIEITRNIPKQRIVYDERHEKIRNWLLVHIRDREMLLKVAIMEGKYSEDDEETKLRCIEKAEDLQENIDSLFDILEENEKMQNFPKLFKSYSEPTQQFSKSAKKSKNDFNYPEERIKSFSSLFRHVYKSSCSASKSRNAFKRIDRMKFFSAFREYLVSKEEHDVESEKLEQKAVTPVYHLYFSLIRCGPVMKGKITYPGNRSLEDYQNYIDILEMAADEIVDNYYTLISQIESLILPLFRYLSESTKKIRRVRTFLEEERSDIFNKCFNERKAFFENFCQNHFKNF